MNRREFLRNFGKKVAGITSAVATPTVVIATDFSDEIKKHSELFSKKFAEVTQNLGEKIDGLNNRMDVAAITQSYQQAQLYIIFMLLIISFVIDGGMTLAWVVF